MPATRAQVRDLERRLAECRLAEVRLKDPAKVHGRERPAGAAVHMPEMRAAARVARGEAEFVGRPSPRLAQAVAEMRAGFAAMAPGMIQCRARREDGTMIQYPSEGA